MFHVKHNKRDRKNSVSFNISITLILNAWVGKHPKYTSVSYISKSLSHQCYKNN